jgi:hypothetical protein
VRLTSHDSGSVVFFSRSWDEADMILDRAGDAMRCDIQKTMLNEM